MGEAVTILYTNYRGETAVRRILPSHEDHARQALWFGSTAWHSTPQWLLTAMDLEKGERRDFAVSDIKAWGQANVDAALAAQDPALSRDGRGE